VISSESQALIVFSDSVSSIGALNGFILEVDFVQNIVKDIKDYIRE